MQRTLDVSADTKSYGNWSKEDSLNEENLENPILHLGEFDHWSKNLSLITMPYTIRISGREMAKSAV